jgi:hypothetical protein
MQSLKLAIALGINGEAGTAKSASRHEVERQSFFLNGKRRMMVSPSFLVYNPVAI